MNLAYFNIGYRAVNSSEELGRVKYGRECRMHLIHDAFQIVSSCKDACDLGGICLIDDFDRAYYDLMHPSLGDIEILVRKDDMEGALRVSSDLISEKPFRYDDLRKGIMFFDMLAFECLDKLRASNFKFLSQ
jgi:hypothetical protein